MQPTKAPWAQHDAPNPPARSAPGHAELDPKGYAGPPIAPLPTSKPQSLTAAPWATTPAVGPGGLSLGGAAKSMKTAPEAIIDAQPKMPEPSTSGASHHYQSARKRITTEQELATFLKGNSIKDFLAFILSLNEAVTGKKATDACATSETVLKLEGVLDTLSTWVGEIPPAEQSLRYGNPSYRVWFQRLAEHAHSLMEQVLPNNLKAAASELAGYLTDSFGNATRIDYGTGHETTFCALLYCLAKLGVFHAEDRQALVLGVFKRYVELMRKVQTTYWLEPAGSHGVWGLDDYQFMPFIWGSAQLISHPMIKPKSIHNQDVLDMYGDENLYLSSVKFVKQVKKGPLHETSPILNDVSAVPSWTKVNAGMIKMYQVEVLSKFPIMQHFLFGSLLPFE